jgi:hypothetical protein
MLVYPYIKARKSEIKKKKPFYKAGRKIVDIVKKIYISGMK